MKWIIKCNIRFFYVICPSKSIISKIKHTYNIIKLSLVRQSFNYYRQHHDHGIAYTNLPSCFIAHLHYENQLRSYTVHRHLCHSFLKLSNWSHLYALPTNFDKDTSYLPSFTFKDQHSHYWCLVSRLDININKSRVIIRYYSLNLSRAIVNPADLRGVIVP
jgi:hypothetical protein